MGSSSIMIVVLIVCLAVLVLPLSIAEIVLGATRPGICDNFDVMGLDVSHWLLGLGISSLVTTVVGLTFLAMMVCGEFGAVLGGVGYLSVTVLSAFFGLAWFIVGAVILFRSNIGCIQVGSSHVIFALVLWCISALQLLINCCSAKTSKNRMDN